MFAATFYDILKHRELFEPSDFGLMAIGFIAAFISALLVVRALMGSSPTTVLLPLLSTVSAWAFCYWGLSFTGVVNFGRLI